MATWKHAELGNFKFDSYRWSRTFQLPAFKVFQYKYRGRQTGSSKVTIDFAVEDEDEFPTSKSISIAKKIVKNEESLVKKLLKALHADLHGKGPDSGMWWHGDVESVYEDLSEQTGKLKNLKLEKPQGLAHLLGSPRVTICEFGYGYDYPLATIAFEALFEIEHGIGILTDGTKIVGTGYEMDASPF